MPNQSRKGVGEGCWSRNSLLLFDRLNISDTSAGKKALFAHRPVCYIVPEITQIFPQ